MYWVVKIHPLFLCNFRGDLEVNLYAPLSKIPQKRGKNDPKTPLLAQKSTIKRVYTKPVQATKVSKNPLFKGFFLF